ncbi:hypothetical protein NEOLEDRAFT_588315 [Neolentinus lepideus HHB14362 ss-1]|uniref:Uncharacterized protein n=1 Tax=Neolentinus lepideus HHB14362 ss-1 TaxID=1314782 RepID=A0A165V7W2_9AGAM|nr:hypothetical protein NEOLEDRAFT_588315 [Neolentinus lepideus HHB14362 ss-1]
MPKSMRMAIPMPLNPRTFRGQAYARIPYSAYHIHVPINCPARPPHPSFSATMNYTNMSSTPTSPGSVTVKPSHDLLLQQTSSNTLPRVVYDIPPSIFASPAVYRVSRSQKTHPEWQLRIADIKAELGIRQLATNHASQTRDPLSRFVIGHS